MSRQATFTSTLREARDHKGYSRENVAPRLDPPVVAKTIERWERGETPAPLWRLEQLAVIYGVSVRELRNGKAATTPSRVNGDGLPTQEVTA